LQWSPAPPIVQLLHTEPAVPHWVSLIVWQAPLKQHPEGQVVASQPEQVPPPQLLPDGHD
jgi:hypothetical protein